MDWDEAGSFEKHIDAIQRCFWKPGVEDIFLALEGEEGEWALNQLMTLRTKSPRTLKVTHRQLSLGLQMQTFEDNMRMEFRIGCRQVQSHDFLEGVRAVIVDKDNKPQWDPPTLAGVSEQMLEDVFAPLEEDELTFEV
jgi:enoyl-CoA hydratase